MKGDSSGGKLGSNCRVRIVASPEVIPGPVPSQSELLNFFPSKQKMYLFTVESVVVRVNR